jgi:hypothetical protein
MLATNQVIAGKQFEAIHLTTNINKKGKGSGYNVSGKACSGNAYVKDDRPNREGSCGQIVTRNGACGRLVHGSSGASHE